MKSTRLLSSISAALGGGSASVPPHVFELSAGRLRYARFERLKDTLEARLYREVEIAAEIFQGETLGGTLRDHEAFERAIRELLDGLDATVEEASLLLPDGWLRTISVELGDVPWRSREEVLRWRLKNLVPFRVEELRVSAVDGDSVDAEGKTLVGFAIEHLMADLESAFRECGVRLGMITNRSLSTASALAETAELGSVVLLDGASYSQLFVEHGRALILRHKALDARHLEEGVADLVGRDLRITASFLRQEHPHRPLSRSLFCGPPEAEAQWLPLLEECLGAPSRRLGQDDLKSTSMPLTQPWSVLAPMLGAAAMEAA